MWERKFLAVRFDVIQQPLEFRRYIQGRYRVVATLASHMVIASMSRSSGHKDSDKKKDGGQKQGGGGKPPQKASVNAVTQQPQQQPARRPQRPQQPCRLGASLCKEAHPLEKCDEFKKMSPEQRVVKANELQLCLICLKHRADRECFAKGKPEFKGCSEGGCGMEHHPLLHWALIEARLFQVQVVADSYPPGTQVFQLRQRVKMGKTEVGLAFDGGSNQSFVTKEYASRKKQKKVGFTVPVIGFGSLEPVMGELYEVPLWASGKRDIVIKAVAVEAIHNGPPARCPENIATRFLQSRNAKSRDLSQAGGVTDICLGMDYPFLQPKYLEKEFTGGQLHLYTSVFGSGLILRGVELPVVREPVHVSPPVVAHLVELPVDKETLVELLVDKETLVELPVDEETLVELPKEVETLVELPEDVETLVELPEEVETLVELPEEVETLVELPEEVESLEEPQVDEESLEGPQVDEESLEEPHVDEESLEEPQVDEESLEEPQVDEESLEEPQVDEETERVATPAKWRRPGGGWLHAGLAMVAMLCLARQDRLVMGFVAYDCANGTNRVDAYSLLEPAACPTHEDHHEVERTIFGEIVQMKKDRTVPVFRCMVIESVMSQFCGFNSAGGVVRYITFREPRRVEAQDYRATKEKGKMSVGGQEFKVTPGTTISHSTFLHGDLTDGSYCETGVLELPGGRKIGGQATQAI